MLFWYTLPFIIGHIVSVLPVIVQVPAVPTQVVESLTQAMSTNPDPLHVSKDVPQCASRISFAGPGSCCRNRRDTTIFLGGHSSR